MKIKAEKMVLESVITPFIEWLCNARFILKRKR